MNKSISLILAISLFSVLSISYGSDRAVMNTQTSTQGGSFPKPKIVPHSQWEAFPPSGFNADAMRRNIAPGENLQFKDLKIDLLETVANEADSNKDTIKIRLTRGSTVESKTVLEGSAFNWNGYHIAIVAVHAKKGELGSGLAEFEFCTVSSMPEKFANALIAGNAAYRARIPHEIKMITLHHSGDAKPMGLQDDPIKKLRGLESFSINERNWWDIPYHFVIMPTGTIYEGRDYHYMGETNTKYNPWGHFLITCEGNYEIQEPTPEVLNSIEDMMAWAVSEFHVPLTEIRGHYQLAETDCPGKNLKKYLEDGTFLKAVKERLKMK